MVAKRRILVTGASSGVGEATARALVARGHTVFGTSRGRLEAVEATGAIPVRLEVTDPASVAALAQLGPLDVLMNNAGVSVVGPVLEVPVARARQVIEVNLLGVLAVCQVVCPSMPPGSLVMNISSTAGRVAYPFFGSYVASKHGLEGLSAVLRRELAPDGIQVLTVGLGNVDTALWDTVEVHDSERYSASLGRFRTLLQEERQVALPVSVAAARLAALCEHPGRAPRVEIVPRPWMARLLRWLPDSVLDRVLRRTVFDDPQ